MPGTRLADVQGGADERGIALAKVGVRDLLVPLVFTDADGQAYPVQCTAQAWSAVAATQRGAHMSRQVRALGELRAGFSAATLKPWLSGLAEKLHSPAAGCELVFALFVERTAPVSDSLSWLDCEVRIDAEYDAHGGFRIGASVAVPVTMLCPCSKEISEYGAHSQRAKLRVALRPAAAELPCLRELALEIERHASSRLYALLKRVDEKAVTERAYERPRFAEDAARSLAAQLRTRTSGGQWQVEVLNYESIHNHNVFAYTDSQALNGQ